MDILQYSELVHLLFWPSRLFKSKAKNITNLAALRYMKRENVSRSVDVLHPKTPLLQLRINESSKNSFWKHVINNTDWALYKEQGSKKLEFQFGLLASSSHVFLVKGHCLFILQDDSCPLGR